MCADCPVCCESYSTSAPPIPFHDVTQGEEPHALCQSCTTHWLQSRFSTIEITYHTRLLCPKDGCSSQVDLSSLLLRMTDPPSEIQDYCRVYVEKKAGPCPTPDPEISDVVDEGASWCPRCFVPVVRGEACAAITCANCQVEFCFYCKTTEEPTRSMHHNPSCPVTRHRSTFVVCKYPCFCVLHAPRFASVTGDLHEGDDEDEKEEVFQIVDNFLPLVAFLLAAQGPELRGKRILITLSGFPSPPRSRRRTEQSGSNAPEQ